MKRRSIEGERKRRRRGALTRFGGRPSPIRMGEGGREDLKEGEA